MLLAEVRAELAQYAKKMYESQLVQATQGNVSVRDLVSGLICLTPSGADYQTLTAEDIVVVDERGMMVEGRWQPTTELPVHTYILRQRRDIHCVMHTHSPYATAFGVIYQPMPIILTDAALCFGGEVPIAPYQPSGTAAFGALVAQILGNGMAVIWGNHGVMVVGINLALTFSAAHALEDNAKVYFIARQLGTPRPLPQEAITELHLSWTKNFGQKALQDHVS